MEMSGRNEISEDEFVQSLRVLTPHQRARIAASEWELMAYVDNSSGDRIKFGVPVPRETTFGYLATQGTIIAVETIRKGTLTPAQQTAMMAEGERTLHSLSMAKPLPSY